MKRNPNYYLKKVGDDFFLVPFGLAIELQAPTVCVNEVAAFLWEELRQCEDIKGLVSKLIAEYEAEPDEIAFLEEDVRSVLQNLKSVGIVLDDYQNDFHPLEYGEREVSKNVSPYLKDIEDAGFSKGELCEETIDLNGVEEIQGIKGVEDEERTDLKGAYSAGYAEIEKYMEIAGVTIRFLGKPVFFSTRFNAFCNNTVYERVDISIAVIDKEPPKMNQLSVFFQGTAITVQEADDFYVLKTRTTPVIREAHISKGGDKAVIYVNQAAENVDSSVYAEMGYEEPPAYMLEMTPADLVFHLVRHPFLLKAQRLGMYVIHSASILYNGKAWLFSALSGTGKSTHAEIWHRVFGAQYLNGDMNLVAFEDEKVVVKGIPWCGTSGIFSAETYPLGGVIFLSRSPQNFMEELSLTERILGLQMRFISPKWNEEQVSECFDFAEKIARAVRIARLHCNMEDEAAEVCRLWIDRR